MTFTPIVKGTPNWDVPLNSALNFVRNEITAGASVINGVTVTNTPVTNNILTATGTATAAWITTPFPSSAVVSSTSSYRSGRLQINKHQ